MADDWDQGDSADWYMEDGFSGGDQESQPTDSLEVFGSNQPTDSLEVFASRAEPVSLGNVLSKPPPLSVSLSPKSQNKMTRSIVEIFELEEDPLNQGVDMGEDGDEGLVVDLEDQRRRTVRLRGALPTLAQLWWSDSDQIDLVAEKLGDGSRDRKQLPFPEYCSSLFNLCGILLLSKCRKGVNSSRISLCIMLCYSHDYSLHACTDKFQRNGGYH